MGTTVVGCGLMGSALARAIAKGGEAVTVWNRTPARAEALVGENILMQPEIVDAISDNQLVVVCTATYETSWKSLEPVADFAGKSVVNLTTGTPPLSTRFEQWVKERGGRYLDGMILAYPEAIGALETEILVAGDPAVWADNEETLKHIGGRARHISADVKSPNVLDVALSGSFYMSAMAAFDESVAYTIDQGVRPVELVGLRGTILKLLSEQMVGAADAAENDTYGTDQATLDIFSSSAQTFLGALRSAGQRAHLLTAACENMEAARAAGHGGLGFHSQVKIAKR